MTALTCPKCGAGPLRMHYSDPELDAWWTARWAGLDVSLTDVEETVSDVAGKVPDEMLRAFLAASPECPRCGGLLTARQDGYPTVGEVFGNDRVAGCKRWLEYADA